MTTINPNFLPAAFFNNNGTLAVPEAQAKAVQEAVQARIGDMPPTEKTLFLALLQASDLSPSSGSDPAQLKASLDALESAAEMFAKPDFAMSSTKLLARLLVEQAAEERKSALDSRLAARESAKTELSAQTADLKAAAAKMLSGAITSLVLTVVMSTVSAVMAGASALKTGKIATEMGSELKPMNKLAGQSRMADLSDVQKLNPDALSKADKKFLGKLDTLKELEGMDVNMMTMKDKKQLAQLKELYGDLSPEKVSAIKESFSLAAENMKVMGQKGAYWSAIGQIGQTVGQIGQGVGGAGQTIQESQSKEKEAEASAHASGAQFAEQQAEVAKNMQDAVNETLKAIINFLKELQDAEVNQMQALTKL